MSFRTEDDQFRIPQEVMPPSVNDIIRRPEYWGKKTLHYGGKKRYFDQDIRTGECYFCKRMGDAQRSRVTQLHHVKYDDGDILRWTIEICRTCHIRIDKKLQEKLDAKKFKARRQRWPRYTPEEVRYLYGINSRFGNYYDRKRWHQWR